MYNNKDDKIWRIYEVVDIETGEVYNTKNYDRKNFITIKIEKSEYKDNGYKIEKTTRIVKHNGQQRIFD